MACAKALLCDRPQLFETVPNSDGYTPPPLNQESREHAAIGFANGMLFLIISSTAAADYYGKQIDELKTTDSLRALALANCLIGYVEACDIPFAESRGGFNRYFSGYLVLRQSIQLFGLLEPWAQFIAQNQNDNGVSLFQDDATKTLMAFPPLAEHVIVSEVLQGLTQFKNSIQLIPGPVASMTLQVALATPQRLMTGLWSSLSEPGKGPGPRPGHERCTFCNGTGKRSSCSCCKGTGRITRMGPGGMLETTSCLVCRGSGRARCDACLGTGKR